MKCSRLSFLKIFLVIFKSSFKFTRWKFYSSPHPSVFPIILLKKKRSSLDKKRYLYMEKTKRLVIWQEKRACNQQLNGKFWMIFCHLLFFQSYDIKIDGSWGPYHAGRPKQTWKKLKEKECRLWKLTTVDPKERSTCRSGARSAMRAASKLPGKGPSDVDNAPAHAC